MQAATQAQPAAAGTPAGELAAHRPAWQRVSSASALLTAVLAIAAGVVIVLIWWAITAIWHVKVFIAPTPAAAWTALSHGVFATGSQSWWPDIRISAEETALGFVIGSAVGIVAGCALGLNRFIQRSLQPYIVAFQAIPKIALAPLLLIWLGFGISSKVAVAAMICFFPVMVNLESGLRSVDPALLELMRSVNAGPWQTFRWLRVPAALPMLFAGLEIGSLLALLGTIVGEYIGAQAGLGVQLITYGNNQDTAGMFGLFVVLAILGIVINQIVRAARRLIVFWDRDASDQTAAV
jgi:NitT/TauT family transport system permease protein